MTEQISASSSLSEAALHDMIYRRRSKQKTGSRVLIGVIVLVCAFAAIKVMSADRTPMVGVVIVEENTVPGSRISMTSLKYREIPAKFASKKMFTSCELLVGRLVRYPLTAYEPIVEGDLFPNSTSFAQQVRPGNRAITIELTAVGSVDDCIGSGDHVDVVATVAKDGNKFTRTVAQDVEVICATPRNQRRGESARATLTVVAEDAETITEAAETGKLRLALRNPNDRSRTASDGCDIDDVLPRKARTAKVVAAAPPPVLHAPPPPPPPVQLPAPQPIPQALPPRPTWTVENFSGSKRTIQNFYDGDSGQPQQRTSGDMESQNMDIDHLPPVAPGLPEN